MKIIRKIAKLELSLLFYSPIAWILSVIFLFQCGLTYVNGMQILVMYQDMGGTMADQLHDLTSQMFSDPRGGMMPGLISKLYLYLPLLTMGLISREVSSGTIKLLYSSPVKVWQIVLGKFLAMMTYNLILVSIIAIFLIFGIIHIQHADAALLFAGLLGIYLLLGAYTAIGLFMSCLTSYQIVAAICTLAVFAVLNYIGRIWQGVDFIRDLTYFLSLNGRTDNMLYGLITTKDIFYFVIITAMFLAFCVIKLQADRESRPVAQIAGRYAMAVVCALAIGYITTIPKLIGYYDSTTNSTNTLTKNAQQVVQQIGDKPLEVTFYFNLLDHLYDIGTPEQRNRIIRFWDPYLRFKPDIKFRFVYYYDRSHDSQIFTISAKGETLKQSAQKVAAARDADLEDFKTPEQIKKLLTWRLKRIGA